MSAVVHYVEIPRSSVEREECRICFHPLQNGRKVVGHCKAGERVSSALCQVHKKCAELWAARKEACPFCYARLDSSSLFSWEKRLVCRIERIFREMGDSLDLEEEWPVDLKVRIAFGIMRKLLVFNNLCACPIATTLGILERFSLSYPPQGEVAALSAKAGAIASVGAAMIGLVATAYLFARRNRMERELGIQFARYTLFSNGLSFLGGMVTKVATRIPLSALAGGGIAALSLLGLKFSQRGRGFT